MFWLRECLSRFANCRSACLTNEHTKLVFIFYSACLFAEETLVCGKKSAFRNRERTVCGFAVRQKSGRSWIAIQLLAEKGRGVAVAAWVGLRFGCVRFYEFYLFCKEARLWAEVYAEIRRKDFVFSRENLSKRACGFCGRGKILEIETLPFSRAYTQGKKWHYHDNGIGLQQKNRG